MTPQEKAKELFDKFYYTDTCTDHYNTCSDGNICNHLAKQCAIICVDEIIWDAIKYSDNSKEYVTKNTEYWQQVKQEIINL